MATSIANLNVMLSANVSRFSAGLAKASKPLDSFVSKVGGLGLKLGGLAAAGGALVGIGSLAAGFGLGIKLAAEYEQAQVAMTTLLGSAAQADKMLGDLSKFAASTPFQFPELQKAATQLIAFGEDADNVVPTLKAIGDVAAGVGQPIGEIAELYGKARVQGRLFGEDINQLVGRGIPIISELAKQFGVAESEVKNLVSSGQVNFGHLQKAFVNLTAEGGKFAGLMDAQSKTLSGVFSTLQDNVSLALRDMAMSLMTGIDIKGLVGQLNAAMPVIQAITQAAAQLAVQGLGKVGEYLTALNGQGGRTGNIVMTAMELGAKGVAYLLDMVDGAIYGYRNLQLGVAKFQRFVFSGYQKLLTLAAKLPDWMGGGLASNVAGIADMFAANLNDEIKSLEGKINKSLVAPSNAEQVTTWFKQVKDQANAAAQATTSTAQAIRLVTPGEGLPKVSKEVQKVTDTLDDLQSKVSTFGQTDAQKQLASLASLGASDDDIAKARTLLAQLEKLDAMKRSQDDMAKAGEQVFSATRSPMEKYESKIGELSNLLNAGAINWDTYGRAVRSAREELEGAAGVGTPEAPRAIRAGSADARRFAFDSSRGMRQLRDDLPKKALQEHKQANTLLDDIRRNTRNLTVATAGQAVEVMEF